MTRKCTAAHCRFAFGMLAAARAGQLCAVHKAATTCMILPLLCFALPFSETPFSEEKASLLVVVYCWMDA